MIHSFGRRDWRRVLAKVEHYEHYESTTKCRTIPQNVTFFALALLEYSEIAGYSEIEEEWSIFRFSMIICGGRTDFVWSGR